MKNIDIDFKILGEHFVGNRNLKSVVEQMRKLKRKHEATGKGLWTVYVKAYNFDIGETLEGGSKSCDGCKHFREKSLKHYYGSCALNKFMIPFNFCCNKHEPNN